MSARSPIIPVALAALCVVVNILLAISTRTAVTDLDHRIDRAESRTAALETRANATDEQLRAVDRKLDRIIELAEKLDRSLSQSK
jgi:chaperonin cofactor prefoldin